MRAKHDCKRFAMREAPVEKKRLIVDWLQNTGVFRPDIDLPRCQCAPSDRRFTLAGDNPRWIAGLDDPLEGVSVRYALTAHKVCTWQSG
jgi:hypothetical protein